MNLVISLVSGAVGGNVAGAALKENSLGPLVNSLLGIVGGGLGAGMLQTLGISPGGEALGFESLLGSIASGGVGGAILMVIFGFIKRAMART
ncbi:MAG: hypothetical protein ACREQ7_04720 [Candidatus Binatia bacterium]